MAKRRKSKKYEEEEDEYTGGLAADTKQGILVIFLFTAAILGLLALAGAAGTVGAWIATGLGVAFGWTRFAFPFVLLILGYLYLYPERYQVRALHLFGLLLLTLAFQGALHLSSNIEDAWMLALTHEGGGALGFAVAYPLYQISGSIAAMIILVAVFLVGLLLTFETSLARIAEHWKATGRIAQWIKHRMLSRQYGEDEEEESEGFDSREIEDEEEESEDGEEESDYADDQEVEPKKKSTTAKERANVTPKSRLRAIDMPLDLLDGASSKPTSGDIVSNVEIIEQTFANFNIDVEMGDVAVGPTVTQYTLRPADGVRVSKINGLSNDLSLALAAHPIRIEAPIPGKSLIGIEVPNQKVALVRLRALLDSTVYSKRPHNLMLALGKDVSGAPWFADLTRMPHMLVAGSTGSGKSVCLNTIILSLMYQNGPDHVKFIFVDPKRVELTVYDGIPHLLTPVVTDIKKTINALKWLLMEMDRRFDLLQKKKKRDIASYNKSASDHMPYIVLVIDELADLMVAAASDVESSIIRLAQMARAVGIHLVLATQRPSVDVITGLIKANIPARIAFSVASSMDSRTILDVTGAEKLVGRGDMLFTNAELSKPKRLQGGFVSDTDIMRVVKHVSTGVEIEYDESIVEKQKHTSMSSDGVPNEYDDPLIPDAKEVILEAGKASASLLQRRLRVGYARAARLLDILESMGLIGPADGAKPRDILFTEGSSDVMLEEEEDDYPEEDLDDNDEEDEEDNSAEDDEEESDESEIEEVDDDEEVGEDEDEEGFDEDTYLDEQEGDYEEEEDDKK